MLTAICPVPNGDHAGLNAVQDSTSQVGLLRPTPRLSDEGKARFFLAVQNGRCWPSLCKNGGPAECSPLDRPDRADVVSFWVDLTGPLDTTLVLGPARPSRLRGLFFCCPKTL